MNNPPPGLPPETVAYPPPGAHAAPPPAYGAQPYPPAYPPYPRQSGSKTLWIVLASIVGTIAVVGGGLYIAATMGAFEGWSDHSYSDSEPVAYSSSSNPAAGATASPTLVGRWCSTQGSAQFNADGTLLMVTRPGRPPIPGTWQEVSAGRINMTAANGRTMAVNYLMSGNSLSMTTSSGATGQYTRC